jgi:hypothetical protein
MAGLNESLIKGIYEDAVRVLKGEGVIIVFLLNFLVGVSL